MNANQKAIEALNAALTHFGMDEDEWNKPTFDQMRAAVSALAIEALPAVAVEAVDDLAQFIRLIDGNNSMGAGQLAERILGYLNGKLANSAPGAAPIKDAP